MALGLDEVTSAGGPGQGVCWGVAIRQRQLDDISRQLWHLRLEMFGQPEDKVIEEQLEAGHTPWGGVSLALKAE